MHFRLTKQAQLKFSFDKAVIGNAYNLGFKAFVSGYLILLMMRVDLLILKQLGTFTQVGIYTLAVNFVDLITMSCNTIGAVLLAKLTSLKNDNEALIIMRKIFLVVIAINFVCIAGMAGLGWWLIRFIYGAAYQQAYPAFLLLIPAAIGLNLGAMFNTFLWSKGFPLFTIIAPAIPLALKVALNYFLIPRYGFYGTSVASSFCYVLWLVILLSWYFTRNKDMKFSQLIATKQDFLEIRSMLLTMKYKYLKRNEKAVL
jgi:O-antigen/teichoic acid export membrane protein